MIVKQDYVNSYYLFLTTPRVEYIFYKKLLCGLKIELVCVIVDMVFQINPVEEVISSFLGT